MTDHPEIAHSYLRWRKSSRSQSNAGANCIEVGAWRKSSLSASNAGQCVEAGTCNCHGVAIRDTTHHASGILSVSTAEWSDLLTVLKNA